MKPLFLFAPGAGAPASHPWMQMFATLLHEIGDVVTFDYTYPQRGERRPDPLPLLIAKHREALAQARARSERPVILIGKSMGGRIGCHVALEEKVTALVCLGYPLCAGGNRQQLRDKVLIALTTPILLVQGTRDPLCPLDLLDNVRCRMTAPNELHIVTGGDHSLRLRKRDLREANATQEQIDRRVLDAIAAFLGRYSS
jgi:predicted alpha/beta-hydrolase family hydrolase